MRRRGASCITVGAAVGGCVGMSQSRAAEQCHPDSDGHRQSADVTDVLVPTHGAPLENFHRSQQKIVGQPISRGGSESSFLCMTVDWRNG